MLTAIALFLSFAAPGIAPPYVFDPVTADINMDDDGTLEVIAFDADGKMDGALLASPQDDHIRIDASFGDGHVSFEFVVSDGDASLRNIDMSLSPHVAERRINTMLAFAASQYDEPESPQEGKKLLCGALLVASVGACTSVVAGGGGGFGVAACIGASGYAFCNCQAFREFFPNLPWSELC